MRWRAALTAGPVLTCLLLLVQVLAPDGIEGLRLRGLAVLARPASTLRALGGASGGDASRATELAWSPLPSDSSSGVAVLSSDDARFLAIVSAGEEAGAREGALAFAGGTLIGIVDRVTAHLARVRGFQASGVRLPVLVRTSGRSLPGGLEVVPAVLAGRGSSAALVETALPLELRRGDQVYSLASGARDSTLLGQVAEEGLEPRVALAAWTGVRAGLLIEGVGTHDPWRSLFRPEPCEVMLAPGPRGRGALLAVESGLLVAPGSAVVASGCLLGRVRSSRAGWAWLERSQDEGFAIVGAVEGAGASAIPLRLRGAGEGWRSIEPERTGVFPGPIRSVMSDDLVPPGLLLGDLNAQGHVAVPAPASTWPSQVTILAFRFEEEATRLRAGAP